MSGIDKNLDYYRKNAEENYITTPISVLRYISELEKQVKKNDIVKFACKKPNVICGYREENGSRCNVLECVRE